MSVMVDYMIKSVKRECEGIDEEEEDEKKESEGRSFMAKLFTPLPYDLVSPLPLSPCLCPSGLLPLHRLPLGLLPFSLLLIASGLAKMGYHVM